MTQRQLKDPYLTDGRFPSACKKCGGEIHKFDRIFYYPRTRAAYGQACGCAGHQDSEFSAAVFDEDMYNA